MTNTSTTRRPAPAERPTSTYAGDGLECIRNLDPSTPKQRLLDVAAWHERRSGKRSAMIARALREAAGR